MAVGLAGDVGAVVYGDDDRRDVYDHPSPAWQTLAQQSIMMMARSSWMVCGDQPQLVLPELTLGEHQELCEGERFFEQPVLGTCSATLIDTDLVVTAAHCVLDQDTGRSTCPTTVFAPGPHYIAGDDLVTPDVEDLYGCRQVLVQDQGIDIAIVQLDRPVVGPYLPAAVSAMPVQLDEAVAAIGFPSGIPTKIADDCAALMLTETNIRHNCDTFAGNSGSGIFSAGSMALVGVMSGGPGDYQQQGDCRVVNVLTEDGQIPGIPSAPQLALAIHIEPAMTSLCATGWPSPVCGGSAMCGDGTCSGNETLDVCPADCAAPTCGDGVCEVSSELDCDADCGHLTVDCPQDGTGTGDSGTGDGDTGLDDTGSSPGDTTASGSTAGPRGTTGAPTATEGSTGATTPGVDTDGGGCGCSTTTPDRSDLALFGLLLFGRRRRHDVHG